jgi:prolyl-tRNA synthetase
VVFTIEEQEIPYQLEIVSQVDRDDQKSMWRKQNEYELKGVPLRVVVGPRDIDQWTLQVAVRDQEAKITTSFDEFGSLIPMLLNDMQSRLLSNNQQSRENNTISVDSWEEFIWWLEQGKFVLAHWDGTPETEKKIKDLCKATIRCIPYDEDCNDLYPEQWMCILTGKLSPRRVLFAIAY